MSKKISLLIPSLSGGGAQKVMVKLANYFVSQGLLVDLVLVKREGPYIKDVDSGVNIVNLDCKRVALSIASLVKYFKTSNTDAVLVTIHHMSIIAIVARVLSMANFRLIIRQPNYLSHTVPQNMLTRFYLSMVCFMFNKSDGVIGISQGVSDDLLSNGVQNVKTIYNPIDFQQVHKMSHEDDDLDFSHPLIIGIGRLEKQKNFSLLIKAFSIVAESVDAQLLILGEGSLSSRLKKEALDLGVSERVQFLGFVDNPYKYLKKSDVFVLSSLWEGFGNVLVESLAVGTQIVSTDCQSGPSEILDNGKYGTLVKVGDSKVLAREIIASLERPIESDILINRSKDFSLSVISKQYLKVLLLK